MFEPIREDLEKVEAEFYRHVESQVDLIPKIGRYIQNGGGKRIRPAVLLMASRLTGYTGELAVLYAAGPEDSLSQVDVQIQLRVEEEWADRRLWAGGLGLQEPVGTHATTLRDGLALQVSDFLREQAEEGTA